MNYQTNYLLFLSACFSGPREDKERPADTGEPVSGEDSDTEAGETDVWIDTAGGCEESSATTSLEDNSLGFTPTDIVATVAATTYANVSWTYYPDGSPGIESLTMTCDGIPHSALIVTRIDHSGLGDIACPPGPELWTFQNCAVNIGESGIVTDTTQTGFGGASLSTLFMAMEVENPTLDSSHSEAVLRGSPFGDDARATKARLDIIGSMSGPPIWLTADYESTTVTGTAIVWDGFIEPPSP